MIRLIRRAIEIDPEERFPDAGRLQTAFNRIRNPAARRAVK